MMSGGNYTTIDSQKVSGSVPSVPDPGHTTVKFTESNLQTFPPSATQGKISGCSNPPRDAEDTFSGRVNGSTDKPQSGWWLHKFTVGAYKPFFDVDTSDVVKRLKESLFPLNSYSLQYTVFDQLKQHLLKQSNAKAENGSSSSVVLSAFMAFVLGAVSKSIATIITYPAIRCKIETMTIINLPRDLVEEIISRIPIKYMRAVRLTCKEMNSLTQSSRFTKLLIGKDTEATREGEFRIIRMNGNDICLMKVISNGRDPSLEIVGKLTRLNDGSNQLRILGCFQVEGLLLCLVEGLTTRLVVWNPFLGQTRWIEPKMWSQPVESWVRSSYVMGYIENKNKLCGRSLKILTLGKSREGDYFEIYDFDSDQWKTLDVISPNWVIKGSGVSLKGNTYWPASECKMDRMKRRNDQIICFDYKRERFGPLLHLPFVHGYYDYVTLFSVREEKLAVAHKKTRGYLTEVEIWMTTKIEVEKLSFSKCLRVDFDNARVEWISFFDEKKFAIGIYDRDLESVHIIGETGHYRQLDLGEHVEWGTSPKLCFYYVPSLVQIIKPAGGK